jgi:hypothetical protein
MIIYYRRPEQRVYSPEEYAEMGYELRSDYNLDFGKADAPLSRTSDLLVYRADTKQEFLRDAAIITVELAIAPIGSASAAGRAVRTAWPVIKTFLSTD